MKDWKCSQCGSCCKIAGMLRWEFFNGKDSVCKHLKNNMCEIYETRPEICRVKDYSKVDELSAACKSIRKALNILGIK